MGFFRLILALSVVVGHAQGLEGLRDEKGASILFMDGDTAVQTFYLISGFYMALILDRVYTGQHSGRAFLISRYLRLAPLYVIVSLITLVFATNPERFDGYHLWILLVSVLSHVTLVGQDVFVFFGYNPSLDDVKFIPDILQEGLAENPGYKPGWSLLMIEPGWSIGLEVWFYLLAPFLLRLHTLYLVLVAAASLGLKICLAKYLGWSSDPWTYRFFPSELMLFVAGSLSYRLYASPRFVISNSQIAIVSLLLLYAYLLCFPLITVAKHRKVWVLFALLVLALPTIFHLTKDWKFDRWIGELSYPVYITHMLVIALLPQLGALKGYAVIAVTLAVSALLLVIVEQPVDRLRHDLAKRMMRSRK